MNNWEILGIEPTNDIEIIKSAYARKSKIYHPETNPVEFQQLHMAYKNTISSLRNPYYTQPEYRVIQERSFNSKRQITLESIPELMNPEDSAQSGTDDIFYADLEFIEKIDNATKKHNDSILEKYGLNTLNDLLTRQSGDAEWRQFLTSLLAKESTPPVYSEVLNDVCETFMNNQWCCDEIRNLYNAINNRM